MILEELYDIVDKKGNKIGEATWTEVHTKGFLHQNVHGIVFSNNSKTQTFIKKRAKSAVQEAGKYEIAVAGHMLSGETPEETIRRELEEELFNGTLPEKIVIRKIATYFNNDIPNNHEIAYLFEVIHPGPFITQREEASKSEWIGWERLLEEMASNPLKYALYSINAINEFISKQK